jgi:acyl transferase domain-containing protein
MSRGGAAVVFPGQGALQRSAFESGALRAAFLDVAAEMSGPVEFAGFLRKGSIATPEQVPLFVLAASVAHYRVLRDGKLDPVVLVGHGFGELAALVCAGALTPKQGADIVLHRNTALERAGATGSMVVARTSKRAARRLVELVGGESIGVAADNAPAEVVVSGADSEIGAFAAHARHRGVAVERLAAPWPLHCRPLMFRAAGQLAQRLRGLSSHPLATPVFSPILGRRYRDSDDLAECLALHLTLPVRFAGAIRHLWSSDGLRTFLVCGPLSGLDRSVQEITRPASGPGAGFPGWHGNEAEEPSGDLAALAS